MEAVLDAAAALNASRANQSPAGHEPRLVSTLRISLNRLALDRDSH
jgi:hypothetical protein